MPGEDIYSWSTVAADNGNADTLINWVEGQTRASVNNSSRSELAAHAKNRNLLTGAIVTTGSANAQAFLSGNSYTVIPPNMHVWLRVGPGLTNTGSMTLNMDGIGNTLVIVPRGANLSGGEFTAGDYVELIWNGTNWVFLYSRGFIDAALNTGIIISQQVFTATGTYTPSAGMASCIIECVGGGAGGGGTLGSQPGYYMAAGGGGSGGYSRKHASASDIGTSQVVTVGAAGGGGGNSTGGNGGTTSVGTLCIAIGGSGGQAASSDTGGIGLGGQGGSAGTGNLTAAGTTGGNGGWSITGGGPGVSLLASGEGGSSIFGGGARGVSGNGNALNGNTASNYGSGGSGGGTWGQAAVNPSGGNGSAGIIIITEFAGRGAPGADGADGAPGPIGPVGPTGPGTGDVLRSGTPTTGQVAVWTDASHIQGADLPSGFTTGDVKLGFKTVADAGWVMMNDGSIGNAASGATTRANGDTVDLFTLLYTNITALVVQSSAGATVARGASAAADYAANRRLVVPKMLGRSLAVAGAGAGLTARTLGTTAGEETHAQTVAEMARHQHAQYLVINGTITPGQWSKGVDDSTGNSTDLQATEFAGSGTPFNIVDPVTYLNVMIKL